MRDQKLAGAGGRAGQQRVQGGLRGALPKMNEASQGLGFVGER